MENRSLYNEILTEHNMRPEFKHDLPDADIVLEGVNPSCGDDIFLKLKLDGDTISDGAFVGDGCAISQASADIMLGMVIGKKKEEALKLADLGWKEACRRSYGLTQGVNVVDGKITFRAVAEAFGLEYTPLAL